MSRHGAEWVSAPTEMKSTPVAAIARTVSRFTPPDASVRHLPAVISTARLRIAGGMLSSSTASGGQVSASSS